MNARYKIRRRGRGTITKKVVLQPGSSPSVRQIPFAQELLAICFALLGIQLKTLLLDVLLGGELSMIGVNIGNYPSISEPNERIIDKVTVD